MAESTGLVDVCGRARAASMPFMAWSGGEGACLSGRYGGDFGRARALGGSVEREGGSGQGGRVQRGLEHQAHRGGGVMARHCHVYHGMVRPSGVRVAWHCAGGRRGHNEAQ